MTSSRSTTSHAARSTSRPTRRPGRPVHGSARTGAPNAGNNAGGKSGNSTSNSAAKSAASQLDAALTASLQTPTPTTGFAELGLAPELVNILARGGITTPTPIQARTLPDILSGRDVLGRAETGSGKTLAFGLPMLTKLAAGERRTGARMPRGLVLVPTRELAMQVADALRGPADVLQLRVGVVFGGAPIGRQIETMRRGVDVLVATPGRLLDLLERRSVRLDSIELAVLDEADHMADLGFMPAVTKLLDLTPDGRQCLFFSATLDQAVARLVTRYLSNPAVHAVASATSNVQTMQHRVFVVDHADKVAVAAEIGAREGRTLFFVRTKHGADRLAKQLTRMGVDAAAIHGNLNQNQRTRALEAFTSGQRRVLTATDVAARGLHVDDLDLVVHFDPSADSKTYLHRSGRTARAGASGTVLSLVEPDQQREVAITHRGANVAPSSLRVRPGDAEVRALAGPVAVRTPSEHRREPADDVRRPAAHENRRPARRRAPQRTGRP